MCFMPRSMMKIFIFILVLLPFIDGRKLHDGKLHCNSEELRYEGHSLSTLHGNIYSHCKKLTSLYLTKNNIKVVEVHAFKNLSNLQQLDLSSNVITALPTGIFSDTQKLENINLSKNRITSLQTKLFSNLPYLGSVNLEQNNITHIQENCFVNVPTLVAINLANNDLKTLQLNIIDDASSLKGLYLIGNPWNCGLDLCEFMHTVVTRFWQEPFVPYCHSPSIIEGATFKEVIETPLLSVDSNVKNDPYTKHVVMHCQTCSKTSLSWQFGKFDNLTNKAIQTSGQYFTSSVLTINEFSSYDEGNYTCYVGNCPTCESRSWMYLHTVKSSSYYGHIIGWSVGVLLSILAVLLRTYIKYRYRGQNQSASGFSPLANN